MEQVILDNKKTLIKEGLIQGLEKGWRGFVWMMKFVVPISFGTMLLSWSGLINLLHLVLAPLMEFLSLPPMAALPLLVGIILGIYGALAVMVVLPFTVSQMTLIAVFLLIAHSLIQEGMIQAKTGIGATKVTLVRLIAAILAVLFTALFLPLEELSTLSAAPPAMTAPFLTMLQSWLEETLRLALKIFVIIMICMALLEIMKKVGFIHQAIKPFFPLIKIMGLDRKTGFIWMTAVLFGLVYGAAIIAEEVNEGTLTKEELEALHLSIGINHAVVEDPLLFMALGINVVWVYVPRLVAAILAVRIVQFWYWLKKRRASRPNITA
ncbi:MAG: hypothetical protein U1D97_15285 [Desulfuromonadales bacterium]|nr:hypothetical protein [Desulfuromonadales bacterium]